jgi:hypothetical protein
MVKVPRTIQPRAAFQGFVGSNPTASDMNDEILKLRIDKPDELEQRPVPALKIKTPDGVPGVSYFAVGLPAHLGKLREGMRPFFNDQDVYRLTSAVDLIGQWAIFVFEMKDDKPVKLPQPEVRYGKVEIRAVCD